MRKIDSTTGRARRAVAVAVLSFGLVAVGVSHDAVAQQATVQGDVSIQVLGPGNLARVAFRAGGRDAQDLVVDNGSVAYSVIEAAPRPSERVVLVMY